MGSSPVGVTYKEIFTSSTSTIICTFSIPTALILLDPVEPLTFHVIKKTIKENWDTYYNININLLTISFMLTLDMYDKSSTLPKRKHYLISTSFSLFNASLLQLFYFSVPDFKMFAFWGYLATLSKIFPIFNRHMQLK